MSVNYDIKIEPLPFGFSDPFGDQWELKGRFNFPIKNEYIKKEGGNAITITEEGIKQIELPFNYIIEGQITIIGYMPDGNGLCFFPN